MSLTNYEMTGRQIALVKNTVAKDCDGAEFDLFMEAARSYGLDPFRKQILPLVFNKGNANKRRMSIVVSRDGLRVIAQRCKNYRPASEKAEWEMDEALKSPLNPKGIVSCTVYLWQQDNRGEWFKVKGEAAWDEFAPIADEWGEDDTGRRRPTGNKTLDATGNWARMPKVMLEKCAEAQALRAGWPDQFSGVYVEEEMDRAKTLDMTASEIVEHDAEERRLRSVGAHNAITVTWGDGWSLENIPKGQFFDRAAEFVNQSTPSEVARWQDANRVELQRFWALSPSDALELKKIVERATAKKEAA